MPSRGRGRSLANPGRFAADDGSPDTLITDAEDSDGLVAALAGGRVLVAVVAVAGDSGMVEGDSTDESSEMSIVSMISADGRRGLLAFTGVDALRNWDQSARPVPVAGVDAARAALEEGCEALVLDVAGPRMQVVPEADLVVLAGIDPVDHARYVTQRVFAETLGDSRVDVVRSGERLQVQARDESIEPEVLAAAITPRILALVPAGIEVLRG